MGLFSKRKSGKERMLPLKTVLSNLSTDSEEDQIITNTKASRRIKRTFKNYKKMPKFRRLESEEKKENNKSESPSTTASYEPPRGFALPSPLPPPPPPPPPSQEKQQQPKKPKVIVAQKVIKQSNRFQRLDSQDSMTEEYEPPMDYMNLQKVKPLSSDTTFDVRSEEASSVHSKNSEATTTSSNCEFRQFVFDKSYNKIERVAVAKSDPGTSDFSDFVKAAANLSAYFPKSSSNIEETASQIIHHHTDGDYYSQSSSVHHHHYQPPAAAIRSVRSIRSQQRRTVNKEKIRKKKQGYITAESLARSQNNSHSAHPPRTMLASSTTDLSLASNVSLANATVRSDPTEEAFPKGHPFYSSMEDGGDLIIDGTTDDDDDPFKIEEQFQQDDSAWLVDDDDDPFQLLHHGVVKTIPSAEDALIDTIRKAASKDRSQEQQRRDPEESSQKRDPSPRGVQSSCSSSDNSEVAFAISNSRALSMMEHVKKEEPLLSGDQAVIQSGCSDSVVLDDAPSVGPQKQPPKGLPTNAILASMLFRQTQSAMTKPEYDGDDDDDDSRAAADAKQPEIPPAIMTDDTTESSVSSVTEEASSFYQKNFQVWKSQAHTALDHYYHHEQQSKKKKKKKKDLLRSNNNNNNNNNRVEQQQPGWLERVEEEHMNMFSA